MPIGPNCRSCGAPLPPDLGWCQRCLAPVTPHAVRPPIHEPGSYVGAPIPDKKFSRWRAGPTSSGPVGRIAWTVALLLIFPWWALVVPLLSVWKKGPIAPDAPPTLLDRFRERHPALGPEIRVGPGARLIVLAVAAVIVVVIFVSKDGVDRYLWAAPMTVAGLSLSLARWNEL